MYVINNMMPVVDQLDDYKELGLAAVANAVKKGWQAGVAWVSIPPALSEMHLGLELLADSWWLKADEALRRLPHDSYMAFQQEGLDTDKLISYERFHAFLAAAAHT